MYFSNAVTDEGLRCFRRQDLSFRVDGNRRIKVGQWRFPETGESYKSLENFVQQKLR